MVNFTFEEFEVCDSNRFAYEVAKIVSEEPGKYSPLFLYGQTYTGKTHLLKAIQYHMEQQKPKKKVVYAKGIDWIYELLECTKKNNKCFLDEFNRKYRDVDMFLLDDVNDFSEREYAQEILTLTLKELELKQAGIVFSSNMPPKELKEKCGFDAVLSAMFIGGMIVKVE